MAKELISIDALRVNTVPAVVTGNFQELNTWLDTLLADKVTVVSEDSIVAEKKVCAELRKLAKAIDAKTKEVLGLVSGDIDLFTNNMKNLKARVLSVADDKAAQITNLENVTRGQIAKLLTEFLGSEWGRLAVEPEFRKAGIDDLVKLTALTGTGTLSKAAQTAVKDKVQADFRLQTNTKARLMELENKCLRADINPPLTRASIESILFADDVIFYTRLDAMIEAEISRKAEAESRLRAKLAAEQQAANDKALAEQQAALVEDAKSLTAAAVQNIPAAPAPAPAQPVPADAVTYTITALISFDIQSRHNASLDKIKAHYAQKFQDEGKRVVSVSVKAKEVRDAA